MRIITPALITLLMLIVIGALIVVYIGKSFFYRAPEPPQEVTTRLVPMASTDIAAGTLITAEHLVTGRLRTDKLTRETILNNNAIIGRYALKDIKQAQPLLTSDLYPPRERPPLELGPGMQAVTIGLGNSTSIVDGLIKPGDYVDVHLTVQDNAADRRFRGGFTMTMFKGVRLIALNRLTQPTDISRGTNTITLEVTRAQANIILEARGHGELTVSLNPDGPGTGGVEIADADRAYFEEILGLPEIPRPVPPFLTEIYRGTRRSTIGYGDDWRGYDDLRNGTPWIEEPGWAPPRNSGRLGTGGGYDRGYNNGYRGGYRGSQLENNEAGGDNGGGVTPRMNPGMAPRQSRLPANLQAAAR